MDAPATPTSGTARPDRRRELLTVLRRASAPLGIAAIAQSLDVHVNTVRFHLDVLERQGMVERVPLPARGRGRPALAYRYRRAMDPGGPRRYRELATVLAEQLATTHNPAAAARDLGMEWGRRTASSHPRGVDTPAVHDLVELLAELGFRPRPVAADTRDIVLTNCPFLELVDRRADVVCNLHLGLMRGVLASWAAPVGVDRLDPLREPDECVAHLTFASPR